MRFILLVMAITGVYTLTMGPAFAYNYYPSDWYDNRTGPYDDCFWDCQYTYVPFWKNVNDQVDVAIMHTTVTDGYAAVECNGWSYETRIQVYFAWVSDNSYYVSYAAVYSPNLTEVTSMVVLTANGWYDGGPAYKAPGDWFYVNLSQQVNSGSDPVRVWVDLNRGWNFTSDQPKCETSYNMWFYPSY